MGEQHLPVMLFSEATPTEITAVQTALPLATIMSVSVPVPLLESESLPAEASITEVLSIGMASRVEWATLQRFPRLRLVVIRSASVSQVDLDACTDAGVTVCNVPHFGDPTVAEHTFALLLALSRRLLLPYQPAAEHCGQWRGWDLAGKTLGIVGIGHIGRRVAQMARVFTMPVLACDAQPDVAAAERAGLRLRSADDLEHWVRPLDQKELQETIQFVTLDELLRRSDIVTLHAPYARQTHHLIDAAAIARMQRGAVLINTARGGLVDMVAVRAALESRQLGGVGLDVVEGDETRPLEETGTAVSPQQQRQALLVAYADLLRRPNVVISPHNAYNSAEAMQRILATTIETIQAYLAGQAINVVNVSSWG